MNTLPNQGLALSELEQAEAETPVRAQRLNPSEDELFAQRHLFSIANHRNQKKPMEKVSGGDIMSRGQDRDTRNS